MRALVALIAVLVATSALAGPAYDPAQTPDTLRDWVDWVRSRHLDLDCARVGGDPACVWMTRLAVDVRSAGPGTFVLDVELDREQPVTLPGGTGVWPSDVRVDGRAAVVIDRDATPITRLQAGRHRLEGTLPFDAMPPTLTVPKDVARIELIVDGRRVDFPQVDAQGQLRLGAKDSDVDSAGRVEIDVSRRLADGVPLVVTTQLDLRVTGAPKELDLGEVALAGTVPVSLSADLPARFSPESHLIVQVRPGSWTVTFDARHEGPAAALSAPSLPAPWPEAEYWAFQPDDLARAVTPSGPPGIDPARTTLPEAWRKLAAFRVSPGEQLTLTELRRGQPEPPPNSLTLTRRIWLDQTGRGLTVQDQFRGTMTRGWRLDAQEPLQVGSASVSGQDQVITAGEAGLSGVELRERETRVVTDGRIEDRPSVLPAVGWNADVQSLSASLVLPPGWALVTALGADSVSGSMLDAWTLFDLFFVLLVGMGAWRVLGLRDGLVMLVALTLARHEVGAPMWIWAALLVVVAITRAVRHHAVALGGRITTWVLLLMVGLILVPWGIDQVRDGIFPVLDAPNGQEDWSLALGGALDPYEMEERAMEAADSVASSGDYSRNNRREMKVANAPRKKSLQYDPSAKVQTGPGIPDHSWRVHQLGWSGPVSAQHTLRLIVLGPIEMGVLAALRVLLFVLLALRFARAARDLGPPKGGQPAPADPEAPTHSPDDLDLDAPISPRGAARAALGLGTAVLLVVGLLIPQPTWAQEPATSDATPSAPSALDELEQRLLQGPDCRPDCLSVASVEVVVRDGDLRLQAQVHAGEATSWPVPGPATTWVPSTVTVDGASASALSRRSDGHLHVRLAPGVHTVVASGPMPPGDALTLQWGARPQRIVMPAAAWAGADWSLEGRRADGTAEDFLQLTRIVGGSAASNENQGADNLAPWVEVERRLDLGIPWRVTTTVRRIGPAAQPLALRVPLLPGESVTDATYEGEGAVRLVTLARDATEVTWTSALEQSPTLSLQAPAGVPWSELWVVSCSPVFACTFEGPPPLSHLQGSTWAPTWRPWPEEQVTVAASRPEGVEGQTTTITSATLELTPGRRQLAASLDLNARTSQGGTRSLTLPAGARLTGAWLGGTEQPLQIDAQGQVDVALKPGQNQVRLTWQQDDPAGLVDRMPAVSLGGQAVNARVTINMPEERWIVMLWGPAWGPVTLVWVYVVLVLVVAVVLSRLPASPLALWQWVLLGMGMTQVPALVGLIVALWLMALGWRARNAVENPWVFNLVQLGLVFCTLVALICLYAAVHAGLLLQPDMQVAGADSSNHVLRYYVDRIDGTLPQPVILSLPLWTWRVIMLLWSLWLAASLVRWLQKGWTAMGHGGWYRALPGLGSKPRRTNEADPETTRPTGDAG